MRSTDSHAHPYIGTLEHQGQRYTVTCRVAFDGIEYVGRLWFAEEEGGDGALPDRAAIPGRTRDDVLEQARNLTLSELELRHRRALAEKRRFMRLRRLTDEILTKVRYLNQLSVSMREGWIDQDGASQEIELTEQQLHECIDRLRENAGVEE
jgi:hypothetical protein